ncbi:glycosyltransferase family 4 protein [Candidatus Saccharibacteria bacterium]|nr:glycosyltransferase family 4 protein [Candidatus Saccharibacteria bacterium]
MNVVVYVPNLGGKTGSPIRALNIIYGLRKFGVGYNLNLVSSGFDDELMNSFTCYSTQTYGGIKQAVSFAVQESRADFILCITHAHVNIINKVARKCNVPLFVDIHGIRSLEILEEPIRLLRKIKNIYECLPWFLGLFGARKIFCANPKLYDLMRIIFWGRAIKVCGITDVSSFKYAENESRSKHVKILYAGNLNAYQGVDLLLDAIELIGDDRGLKFYLASNSDISNVKLRDRIIDLKKSSNLYVIDPIAYKLYPKFLATMDVFVIPRKFSLTAYLAFPQKIVESMSSGKCVIATDIAPHRFALKDPLCGILCKPDPKNLANAIIRSKNRKLRMVLGKLARKKATESYDISVQIPKIIRGIEEGIAS